MINQSSHAQQSDSVEKRAFYRPKIENQSHGKISRHKIAKTATHLELKADPIASQSFSSTLDPVSVIPFVAPAETILSDWPNLIILDGSATASLLTAGINQVETTGETDRDIFQEFQTGSVDSIIPHNFLPTIPPVSPKFFLSSTQQSSAAGLPGIGNRFSQLQIGVTPSDQKPESLLISIQGSASTLQPSPTSSLTSGVALFGRGRQEHHQKEGQVTKNTSVMGRVFHANH
ncbi:MAG: hypothetical protein JSR33_09905 [Proteobacteria bacterium]|nr:hypothetical protein [Pseudomonadota bacterium]